MPEPQSSPPVGPSPADGPLVFVSAAEPSGDQHAASLIQAIRKLLPQVRFRGVAGPLMQAAGCEAIDDLTSRSAMLVGAVKLAGHAWRLLGRVEEIATRERPSLAILVDSPTLHLPMARRLKAAGCPVLYYIAPQLWAWAPWRIRRVRRRVDRVAVLLPFEEKYFRDRGVDARFVGHPLVEQLSARQVDQGAVGEYRRAGHPVIACLPGSRSHVLREVLPGQIEVAREIARRFPEAVFLFAAAHDRAKEMIAAAVAGLPLRHRIVVGQNGEMLSAADLALCASGTATLEVAWYRVPMIVMYNGSKWGYRLVGRFLIRTPHLSLVNILSGRRAVPEFMPYYTSTRPIAAEALDLLSDQPRRVRMRADLEAVIRSLGQNNAAQGAAEIAVSMIQSAGPSSPTGLHR